MPLIPPLNAGINSLGWMLGVFSSRRPTSVKADWRRKQVKPLSRNEHNICDSPFVFSLQINRVTDHVLFDPGWPQSDSGIIICLCFLFLWTSFGLVTVLFWSVKAHSWRNQTSAHCVLDLLSFSFIHLASHRLSGRNDRLVWLKFSKTAIVLIDQSLSMLLLSILLHPIRVIHYTVLDLCCCCCWYCASSGFIEHSADIQPSISALQGETLDDM